MEKRADDFEVRRGHLKNMSDAELKAHYEELLEKLVNPLVEMGRKNTSPAIERSVLLRMGFSSIEAGRIVNETINHNLLGHGAGNIVYRLAKDKNIGIREAGLLLIDNPAEWDKIIKLF